MRSSGLGPSEGDQMAGEEAQGSWERLQGKRGWLTPTAPRAPALWADALPRKLPGATCAPYRALSLLEYKVGWGVEGSPSTH